MLIVTREGDRRCKLRPSQRALVALVDGTIAEGNRIRDRESGYSGKTRRHGVNIQAATGPAGELL